jgi:hypothetical protein
MPQPLSRVKRDAGVIMCNAGDRPLNHNPALGILAMEAIISWSNVESFMLDVYLQLMGGPTELAAIGFLALEQQSAKIAVIMQSQGKFWRHATSICFKRFSGSQK